MKIIDNRPTKPEPPPGINTSDPTQIKTKADIQAEETQRLLQKSRSQEQENPIRGLIFALPGGIVLWIILIGSIMYMVRGCRHKEPGYKSVGTIQVSTNVLDYDAR